MRRSWLIALLCMPAAAATLVEGPTALVNGSTIVKSYPAPGLTACKADVAALAGGVKRYCRIEYTTKAQPVPVDCAVSAWAQGPLVPASCPASGTQSRTDTRTVVTPASNGGAACPALTQTAIVPCAPPVVAPTQWVQAADEGGSFTLYTAASARFGADTRWSVKDLPAGTYGCSNSFFGDPAFLTAKACQVSPASALQKPSTTPAPPPVVTGTASISWTVPSKNTDGSALTDLAGFKVYHGTSAGALTDVLTLPAPVNAYTFKQLAAGTHFFAVTAYTTAGVESAKSAVGSKTIP